MSTIPDEKYSQITPKIMDLTELCYENDCINPVLYKKYSVNRGLRDSRGKGILTGLTQISESLSMKKISDKEVACDGELYYRGYNINNLVDGFIQDERFGFEEISYLLLFGDLPNKNELKEFSDILSHYRTLPPSFVRDIILKAPSKDMMNTLSRSVLTLYSYDAKADDISIPNVLRQSLQLIAIFPLLSVYGYQAYNHYHSEGSLYIHMPSNELSTAENLLYTLRPNQKYTKLEARILDLALVLHAEHGGGNNSTFTNRVVTSSGTDTYSAISAALGSLKGPKHGGANKMVVGMFEDIKKQVHDWTDDGEVSEYLKGLLNGEKFDKKGLIYGVGHAFYTLSDPRAKLLKEFARKLSEEKGMQDEFNLYEKVENLAPKVIASLREMPKPVSANVDFYSGFVYRMLNLPIELFTPIFAIARISGWSAHRIEELISSSKIIRPSYMNVQDRNIYIPINER